MNPYRTRHWGAIGLGVLCTAGAAAVLVEDARTTGPAIDHALAVIALVVAIGAGKMAADAAHRLAILRAAALGLLFVAASTWCVAATAGRNHEADAARLARAAAHNQARSRLASDLDRARLRHAQAEAQAEREMTGAACGRRCDDWKLRAKEVAASIREMERDLRQIGEEQNGAPRTRALARLLTALGAGGEQDIASRLDVVIPYWLPLILELGAIVFWHVGLGRTRDRPAPRPASPSSAAPLDNHDAPIVRPDTPGDRPDIRKARILAALRSGQSAGSSAELCLRYGIPRSTMSDWLREWERSGAIPVRRIVGRCKAVLM